MAVTNEAEDLSPLLRSRLVLAEPHRLVFPPAWAGHIPFAFWLVEALRPRLLVELGTHSGNSYCAFLQALAGLDEGARAFAVDTWTGDGQAGLYDEAVYSELAAYHDPRYGRFSTLLRMTFDEALPRFADGSIDLLHIDGLHTYPAVRHDFETWLPKMSDRGVVLMHDTHVDDPDFGVGRLLAELSARYPSFAFDHSHGLGVVHVGSAPMPDDVRWLFEAMARGGDAATAARRYFARLGQAFPELVMLAEATRQRDDASAVEVERLEARLRTCERELAGVYASTSWRLTAGLRHAKSAVRRLLRGRRHWVAADLALDPGARFDAAYYLALNPEVRGAGLDPWHHFVTSGAAEGRRPNPFFDPVWYLAQYPDARKSGRNPLVHYLLEGAAAGHDPGPDFSVAGYLATYPEVAASGAEPLDHYLRFGRAEGRITVTRDEAEAWLRVARPVDRYDSWQLVNRLSRADVADLREALAVRGAQAPRISIVTPVHEPQPAQFAEMLESVLAQIHEDWELCLVDDGSRSPHVGAMLQAAAARDPRIRVGRLDGNRGVSAATNAAIAMASGEVVAFLDQGDLITPDCLAELAIYYADNPSADLVYSDDDKIDASGRRYDPRFKPDWSPVLLLSHMYLCHVVSVRRTLLLEVGGLRSAYDGSQDHDLALRLTEKARHVGHVPKVLYHQRGTPGLAAVDPATKASSVEAARRAVAEAIARRGLGDMAVANAAWATRRSLTGFELTFPDHGPDVTIVIPTRNKRELLKGCIESLAATTYRNYDVVVIDNDSDDRDTLAYLSDLRERPGFRVVRIPSRDGRFNFAALNNEVVREHCTSDYVLFLNNDTSVVEPRWLSAMIGYAGLPGVGTVGARLFYADGTIQHAGTIAGYGGGLVGHAFLGASSEDVGYLGLIRRTHECSAVTGACMLVARHLFERLGGFDAVHFAVAFNDIDFGYRVLREGLRNIYCAEAALFHFEGQSRPRGDAPSERAAFRRRYGDLRDPWYNPNLSRLLSRVYQPGGGRPASRRARPIALAVVATRLDGDAAIAVAELVLALAAPGDFRIRVFAGADGPLRASYAAAGIPIEVVAQPGPEDATPETVAAAIAATAQRFREADMDLVLADGIDAYWAVAAAEQAGLPAVWRQQGADTPEARARRLAPGIGPIAYAAHLSAYRIIHATAATLGAVSVSAAHGSVGRVPPARPLGPVIDGLAAWSGETARRALDIADDEAFVLVIGFAREAMRLRDAVDACAMVAETQGRRLHVAMLGAVEDAGHVEAIDARAVLPSRGPPGRIRVVDPGTDPFLCLAAADIAVCPGTMEAAWRDVVAAMVAGLPLVVARGPATLELAEENVNALVYPAGDVAALAGRLMLLVHDGPRRRVLGRNGLDVLEARPSFAETVSRHATALREAVNLAVGEEGRSTVAGRSGPYALR